jgi:hypothetical protein
VGETNTKWEMMGVIPLFDPPRHDTKDTIENCHAQVSKPAQPNGWRGHALGGDGD